MYPQHWNGKRFVRVLDSALFSAFVLENDCLWVLFSRFYIAWTFNLYSLKIYQKFNTFWKTKWSDLVKESCSVSCLNPLTKSASVGIASYSHSRRLDPCMYRVNCIYSICSCHFYLSSVRNTHVLLLYYCLKSMKIAKFVTWKSINCLRHMPFSELNNFEILNEVLGSLLTLCMIRYVQIGMNIL